MSDDYEVHSETYKGHEIVIKADSTPDDPRSWDNAGTIVTWHRRYELGDERPRIDPQEWLAEHKNDIVLPIYMYDHSGITINTTGFSCPWDSGQVGYIFITRKDAVKEWGKKLCTKDVEKRAIAYLKCEVKTYDDYLTGNVYGYDIDDGDGDSCWGYYPDESDKMGYEGCLREAKSIVDYMVEKEDEKKWQGLPGIGLPVGAF